MPDMHEDASGAAGPAIGPSAEAFSIAALVDPIDRERFIEAYWEKDVLVVNRDRPDYYRHVLSVADLDHALATQHLTTEHVSMVNARLERPLEAEEFAYPSGLVDPARVSANYADGATLIMSQMQQRLGNLADLCRALEAETGHRFQTNLYLTPPGDAQGFRPHFDGHDVFVLQIAGSKAWTIYDTPVTLPDREMPFNPAEYELGEVTRTFTLHAGDIAYVPRGVVHDAHSTDEMSLHITLGAIVRTWADMLQDAIILASRQDAAFRAALPIGFHKLTKGEEAAEALGDQLGALYRRVPELAPTDALLQRFADDIISTRHGLLAGQLQAVMALDTVGPDTELAPRPNLMVAWEPDSDQDTITAHIHGKGLTLPAHAEGPLRFALSTGEWRPRDLPDLDEAGQMVLARRLIREGLVRPTQ
jgi:ribosomal protein L16 Arg81 hydroxylase